MTALLDSAYVCVVCQTSEDKITGGVDRKLFSVIIFVESCHNTLLCMNSDWASGIDQSMEFQEAPGTANTATTNNMN